MPGKRINPRLVKKSRPYQVGELAGVLGVHKNTILNWVKVGLSPVDRGKPLMFRGKDVIDWLLARREKTKRPCPPGTMYCLRCREPRAPALGIVDCYQINSSSGNLQALCEKCEAIMNRRAALNRIATVMPGIEVQFPQVRSRLKGRRKSPLNCDSGKDG